MKGNDISDRLLDFSARIIKVTNGVPKTTVGKHVGGQVIRSGTSAGANYEEARGSESKADFAHKLGLTLKELRETRYWLRVLERAEVLPAKRLSQIIQESEELCNIIAKSIFTVRGRKNS